MFEKYSNKEICVIFIISIFVIGGFGYGLKILIGDITKTTEILTLLTIPILLGTLLVDKPYKEETKFFVLSGVLLYIGYFFILGSKEAGLLISVVFYIGWFILSIGTLLFGITLVNFAYKLLR